MQNSRSIIIGTSTKLRVVLVIGYVIFGLYSLRELGGVGSAGIIALICVSAIGAVHIWYISNSYIELNDENIIFSFPPKRVAINWSEIRSVEISQNMATFRYGDKQMGMSLSPKSSHYPNIKEFINEQCRKRKIEIR